MPGKTRKRFPRPFHFKASARADKGVKHKACQSVSLSVTEILCGCVCGCVIPAKIRYVLYTCNQQSFLNESTLKVGKSLRRAAKGISKERRGKGEKRRTRPAS